MEQILGPLEQKVMTVLWQLGHGTVREVLDRLESSPKPAYTTVMTIMFRLHEKELLSRSPRGNSFVYQPTMTPDGLIEDASRKAVRDVLERFGELAVVHFLEAAELSGEQVQRLLELIPEDESVDEL